MSEQITQIDYAVIDESINNIQNLIDDSYVSDEINKIKSLFEYSNSEYVNIIKNEILSVENINQKIVALMSASNEMLKMAKTIYQNLDADMAVEINSDK